MWRTNNDMALTAWHVQKVFMPLICSIRHPRLARSGLLQLLLNGICLETPWMCPSCPWNCSARRSRWPRSRAGRHLPSSLSPSPVSTSPSPLGFSMWSLLSLKWQLLAILLTFGRGAYMKFWLAIWMDAHCQCLQKGPELRTWSFLGPNCWNGPYLVLFSLLWLYYFATLSQVLKRQLVSNCSVAMIDKGY